MVREKGDRRRIREMWIAGFEDGAGGNESRNICNLEAFQRATKWISSQSLQKRLLKRILPSETHVEPQTYRTI